MNNILVVGLGYIGLPLALRLAEIGHNVYGEDIDADRRKCIENRVSPWPMEPEIGDKLKETTLKLWDREPYDTIIFCVNVDTADCKQLLAAMGNYNLDRKLVIIESTLPPNGTDKVMSVLPESVHFAYCPERLTASRLWWSLCHLPRVIGGSPLAYELYTDLTYGEIVLTDLRTAELVKLAENTYRYEKIDFANRLALRCQELPGGDVWKVADILWDKLGVAIPLPGAGIGGYCLEKDSRFLDLDIAWYTKEGGLARSDVFNLVFSHICDSDVVVLMGMAYKADVADARNSPGEALARDLAFHRSNQVTRVDAIADLPSGDIFVIIQPHSIYKAIDWRSLQAKTVIDLCGFFQRAMTLPDESERGWEYVCLGVNG